MRRVRPGIARLCRSGRADGKHLVLAGSHQGLGDLSPRHAGRGMSTISPRRLEAAMSAAQQIKELLPYDDDNKLLIDTVDGETEVFTLLDRLAEAAIADKELAEK